jgi:hypothetical protein
MMDSMPAVPELLSPGGMVKKDQAGFLKCWNNFDMYLHSALIIDTNKVN